MRILVTGGRDYSDHQTLFATLDQVHQHKTITCVVHGAARGADRLAEEWAQSRRIPTMQCPANWRDLGRAAGLKRNAQMLVDHQPELVVAFPGGRGTLHMCRLARKAGIRLIVVAADGTSQESHEIHENS